MAREEFNRSMAQDVENRFTDARNRATTRDFGVKQGLEGVRAENVNADQLSANEIAQRGFENKYKKATGQGGTTRDIAGMQQQSGTDKAAAIGALGQMAGGIASAYGQSEASERDFERQKELERIKRGY